MARTKRAGVESLGGNEYRIRATYVDPKTGRQKEIDRLVQARDALEADALRHRFKAEKLAERSPRRAQRLRLADAAKSWCAAKRRTIRASTARTYGDAMDRWTDALGDHFVDAIEPDDVRRTMDGWSASLAPASINARLRPLRTFAKETGNLSMVAGVRELADAPDLERTKDDHRKGLRLEELRAFLRVGPRAFAAWHPDVRTRIDWWPLLATLALTGMRWGEVTALRWDDVDLGAGIITVRRSQVRHNESAPKTRAGLRDVAMPPELVAVLRKHRARTAAFEGVVFKCRAKHVSNSVVRRAMGKVLKLAGIDLAGRPMVHCLRHAWNNAVRQVTPEHVRQSILGHADEASGRAYTAAERREQGKAVRAAMRLVKGR